MSMFNREQLDHMKSIASLPPEKVCACGWFSKKDCKLVCCSPEKRDARGDTREGSEPSEGESDGND